MLGKTFSFLENCTLDYYTLEYNLKIMGVKE